MFIVSVCVCVFVCSARPSEKNRLEPNAVVVEKIIVIIIILLTEAVVGYWPL